MNGVIERTRGGIFALPSRIRGNKNHKHHGKGPPESKTKSEKYVEYDLVAAKASNLVKNLVRS